MTYSLRRLTGRRYNTLKLMVIVVVALSLFQILWAPEKARFFKLDVGEPTQWKISYASPDGQKIVKTVAAPVGQNFVEGRANGMIRIEMDLRECRAYRQYRFWVGPYGTDSTKRQPVAWDVFVRDGNGEWIKADTEDFEGQYTNNRWYLFSLHSGPSCIRHVQMNISKIANEDIFRLYEFQLYNPNPLERVRNSIGL